MKRTLRSLPFIFLAIGLAGLFGLMQLRQDPPSRDQAELAPLVETVPVLGCDDGFSIWIDGEVIPYREISLASEVRGRIVKKTSQARAGRYVRKASLLFQVDRQDYELELKRLQETVKQANSSIEESDVEERNVEGLIELAEAQLSLQRAELVRFENLRLRNAVSDSQLESARQAELAALNSLQTLKNQITLISARRNRLRQEKERALTSLDQARLNLDRTTITSPIDGMVIQDLAEQDDYVQEGSALVQLEDTSKVEVRFSLRMAKLRWLWTSTQGATLPSSPQQSYALPAVSLRVHLEIDGHRFFWPARLDRYDGAGIHAATRTAPIIATVDDPTAVQMLGTDEDPSPLAAPPALLRGTFVTVEIPVGSRLKLVRIPALALRPGGRVWTWRHGKLNVESVKVAHADGDQVILLTDPGRLRVGDEVITSPLPLVIHGMDIRRTEREDTSNQDASIASSSNVLPDPL